MKLIATLQNPPPATAPKALKTEAWADKQLWTQLGAWAQQRHTWALHAKLSVRPLGGPTPTDAGMVSPYPKFFASLGDLSQLTAKVLAQAGIENTRDAKLASEDLLAHTKAYAWYDKLPENGLSEQQKERLDADLLMIERMYEFLQECADKHQALLGPSIYPTSGLVLKRLRTLALNHLKTGGASKNYLKILNIFARSDGRVLHRMNKLAKLCDNFASIARKQLEGKPLSLKENTLIRNYGPTLAFLHFYEDLACVVPMDDFPIISPVFVNPFAGRTLYAALGRPHALYVQAKLSGKTRLMRGAVLSYREFQHPISQPLDDESWRRIVREGKSVPQPPRFTKSFIVQPSEDEVVEMLGEGKLYVDIDNITGSKITRKMIEMLPEAKGYDKAKLIGHLGARCTEKDAATLLRLMRTSADSTSEDRDRDFIKMMKLVAAAPCRPIADELMQMLTGKDPDTAHAAAYILSEQPYLIDPVRLTSAYDSLPTSRRVLYCFLLGYLPKVDQTALDTMLKALNDRDACLRWQGAVALGRSDSKDQAVIKALIERVDDSNVYVASASLHALNELKAPLDAKVLIEKLKRYCRNYRQSDKPDLAKKALEVPGHGKVNILEPGDLSDLPDPDLLDRPIKDALVRLKYKQAMPVFVEIMAGEGFPNYHFDFFAIRDLDRENYPERLANLALNDKLPMAFRIEAMEHILYCYAPARACMQLIPLLGDQTPIPAEDATDARQLGDLAVVVIAGVMFLDEYDTIDVGDEYGIYTEQFKKFREKVRKWARSTTQPAGK